MMQIYAWKCLLDENASIGCSRLRCLAPVMLDLGQVAQPIIVGL